MALALAEPLDLDVYDENGLAQPRTATSAPLYAGGGLSTLAELEVEVESGAGLTTGQGSDPQAVR